MLPKKGLLSKLILIAGCMGLIRSDGCKEIEEAMAEYFGRDHYYFTLYAMMGEDMTKFITQDFKGKYDVKDKDQRHEFACKLANSETNDDMAETLDETFGEGFGEMLIKPISTRYNGLGSIKKLEQVADEYIELLSWAHRSHYPLLPIKSDRRDTIQTFTDVKMTAKQKHISSMIDQLVLPMPVLLRPYDATKLVEQSKTYEDLDKGMDLDKGTMRARAEYFKKHPNLLEEYQEDIFGFLHFIKALDSTGYLL